MEQIPYWKSNIFSASQELAEFHGNQRFISMFTTFSHVFHHKNPVHVLPSYIFPIHITIIILPLHLHFSSLHSSAIPTKTLYIFPFFPMCATYPVDLIIHNSSLSSLHTPTQPPTHTHTHTSVLQCLSCVGTCKYSSEFHGRFHITTYKKFDTLAKL